MDEKMLEYMSKRVDRAKKIKETLKRVQKLQEGLESESYTGVKFESPSHTVKFGRFYYDDSTNIVVRECKEAAIQALIGLKNDLEKELAEL